MAYEIPCFSITLEAGEDLSAKQYHFVLVNSSGKAVACTGITNVAIGVLQNKPTSGQAAEIMVHGVTKVVADGTLDEGNLIGTSADAQADAIAAGTDTTVYIMGVALEPAAAGDTVAMLLRPAGRAA